MRNNPLYNLLKKIHWLYVYHSTNSIIKITEPYFDKKFNIATYKTIRLRNDNSVNGDATFYGSVPYIRLYKIFRILNLTNKDVLLDIGGGLGRIVLFSKLFNIKKAISIELDSELHEMAIINSESCNIKSNTEIEFVNADAVSYINHEITTYVLFNPFGIVTLNKVFENIKESLRINPRKIQIVYLSGWQRDCQAYVDGLDWLKSIDHGVKHIPPIYKNVL